MCVKGPNETPRHLHITNFGALNNLLQKELLIRALYTHVIEEGGGGIGKRDLVCSNQKTDAMSGHLFFR